MARRHKGLASYRKDLFSSSFLKRTEATVFLLGTVKISHDMLTYDLRCPFPHSAVRLQHVLEEAEITSLKRLHSLGLHGLAALIGVGDSLCDVATIILDYAGYDIVEFCGWKDDEVPVRFQTLKARQRAQKARRTLPADRPYLPSDFHTDGTPRPTVAH